MPFSSTDGLRTLNILYQDEFYVVVDKPSGIFVHRTELGNDSVVLLQLLRDQIGQKVYPIHRLDKPTSGVMIFALSSEAAREVWQQFQDKRIMKQYHAVVRGYTDDSGTIDYDLVNQYNGKVQSAITHYKTMRRYEFPVSCGKYETTRVSLVSLNIETGRLHQIRRHMKHIFHPVIGDTTYGDTKYNTVFRDFGYSRLMLQSVKMDFFHPFINEPVRVELSDSDLIDNLCDEINK